MSTVRHGTGVSLVAACSLPSGTILRVGSTHAVHREKNTAMTARIPPVSRSPGASHTDDTIPPQLLRAIAPLHGTAMGVAWAVVCGGLLALATLYLVLRGPTPLEFDLLSQFFWGYRVSVGGIFIGLLWGAGVGFVLGYCFVLIRNGAMWIWLTTVRSRTEMEQYSDFLDRL
jgi:hypothetical protein